jgi:spermidine/putrescine transport system ATP-binding protein
MNNGHIEDEGPPERVYMKPRTIFTATFMGESNMFEGQVVERTGDQIDVQTAVGRLRVPGDVEPGASVHLSIRPEQIKVGEGNLVRHLSLGKLKVREVSFFGTHHRCQGRHLESDLPMTIRLPQHQVAQVGQELTLSVACDDIVLLTR